MFLHIKILLIFYFFTKKTETVVKKHCGHSQFHILLNGVVSGDENPPKERLKAHT